MSKQHRIELITSTHELVEQGRNCLQGLGALPEELVIRILRAASTPLPEQIRLLPIKLHTAAVHAAYPTIPPLTLTGQFAPTDLISSVLRLRRHFDLRFLASLPFAAPVRHADIVLCPARMRRPWVPSSSSSPASNRLI